MAPPTCMCFELRDVTSEFPAQRARNAENISIWWRHNDMVLLNLFYGIF